MEEQEFCVKINGEGEEIKFYDENIPEDRPSSFEVMMDFVPVYYAYKFYENREYTQIIEEISSKLSYLSHFYRCLKKLESGTKFIADNHDLTEHYISTIIEIGTKIINNFESRFIHDSDVFIDEIFNDSRISIQLDDIKHLYFYIPNCSIIKKIKSFKKRVKDYIHHHSAPQIDYVLRILTELFVTDLESSWLNANIIQYDFNTVFCENNSIINFPSHPIPYTSLLLSTTKYSILLQRKKQELAHIIALIPYPPQGFKLIEAFDEALCKMIPPSKARNKYLSDTGCFAIMENSNNIIYYAISGIKSKESAFDDLCNQIENIVFKNINVRRCLVSQDMVRYKYSHPFFCTPLYPKPIFYKNDYSSPYFQERNYTCCERKILPYLQPNENNNTFFIRWAPCSQCRPAIYNRYTQIFAFYRDPAKNHPYDSSILKEFHIREVIAYALEDTKDILP